MKMLVFFILSILNCHTNVASANFQKLEGKNSSNKPQNIEVTYTLSMKLDEEKLKNFPDEIKQQIKDKLGGDKTFILKANSLHSVYMLEDDIQIANEVSETTHEGKVSQRVKSFEFGYSNYFKDFEAGTVLQQRFLRGETYLIDETMTDYDWKIDTEVIEISGYKCRMARTISNGSEIKVWFTEDIAISDGPLTYSGLPGLILKVETSGQEIFATKIAFPERLSIQRFSEGKVISKEAMQELTENFKKRQEQDGANKESFRVRRSN